MATIISTKTSGVGGLEVTGDATGILQLASNNGTTAVTVDASQNVGIGTASPSTKFHVYSSGDVTSTIGSDTGASIINLTSNSNSSGAYNAILSNTASGQNWYIGGLGVANTLVFATGASTTERMRITSAGLLQFNSGYGSVATAYGCRAWVNFNGTGTVAIRASGNVTSITDNGTGNYTVNFTTAMPDANYSAIASGDYTGTNLNVARGAHVDNFATGSYRVSTGQTGTGTKEDFALVTTSVFR